MTARRRRRHGFTVRQLRSGRWQLLVRDQATGEQVGHGTFDSEKAAEVEGQRQVAEQESGRWHDPRRVSVPLVEVIAQFLADRRKAGRHSPRYAEGAEQLARDWIVPYLGERSLGDLSPAVIRAWHEQLTADRIEAGGRVGLVPAKAFRLLSAVLNQAVRDEVLPRNPCLSVQGAGVERSARRRIPEPSEVALIAQTIDPRYRALILVAGWCGLRFGELAALERRHVNVLRGELHVERAKTEAGQRTVTVPAPVMALLAEHLEEFTGPDRTAWVFAGPKGGALTEGNFWIRHWRPTTEALGLQGMHFHDLRHHAGTMAAQTGATLAELQGRLGHATPDAAMRYQHAARERDQLVADRLGAMMPELPARGDAEVVNARTTRTRRSNPKK